MQNGRHRQAPVQIQKQAAVAGQFHHLAVPVAFSLGQISQDQSAVKLHLLLDHDGYLPTYAYISNGKKHDVTVARKVPLSPYSIVAMDKGYNDYSLFAN